MSELEQEVLIDGEEIEIPSALPVLPLKETWSFRSRCRRSQSARSGRSSSSTMSPRETGWSPSSP